MQIPHNYMSQTLVRQIVITEHWRQCKQRRLNVYANKAH